MASKPDRARIPLRARRSPRAGLPVPRVVLLASQVPKRVAKQAAKQVPKQAAKRVAKQMASLVRRPALRLPAEPLVVVRKRAVQTGARPSCGVSMNRWAFLMAASGRNSRCWRRTVPRALERRAMARVPGPMLRATAQGRPATALMAKAARVAKAARTAA